jgi:hypothetical protein
MIGTIYSVPEFCTWCEAEATEVLPVRGSDRAEVLRFCDPCAAAFRAGQRYPEEELLDAAEEPVAEPGESLYDWNRVPERLRWLAVDQDGALFGYSHEPALGSGVHMIDGGIGARLDPDIALNETLRMQMDLGDCPFWDISLEERPPVTESQEITES